MLNYGSLLLGIIAWIVPILAIKRPINDALKSGCFIIVSFSACVMSLCLQLFEINHRVQIQDWSAIIDTIGTLKMVAVILALTTLILNIMVLVLRFEKETKT